MLVFTAKTVVLRRQLSWVEWEMMVKLASAYAYANMHLKRCDVAGDKGHENEPLWHGKIFYPITLMETSPPSHPLTRES